MNMLFPATQTSWIETVSPGNVLVFRFPYPSPVAVSSRALRPCIVLDVENYLGARFLELIPGTQTPVVESDPDDFCLDPAALLPECQKLGSWRFRPALADRFDAAHPGFARAGESPLIGRARGPLLGVLDNLRDQSRALRELHVLDRRTRRARHRKSARTA